MHIKCPSCGFPVVEHLVFLLENEGDAYHYYLMMEELIYHPAEVENDVKYHFGKNQAKTKPQRT